MATRPRRDGVPELPHWMVTGLRTTGAVVSATLGAAVSAISRLRPDPEPTGVREQSRDAQRLRLALEAARMGTWRWDLASDRVEWDESLEALFGLPSGSFDGSFETYRALLHPEDRERVAAAVDRGIATNTGWQFDHRVLWPDGTTHWLEGRGEPVHDDNGIVTAATGVSMNVDARHALLEAEQFARLIAEQASATVARLAEVTTALAGASRVDEVGRVIVANVVNALRAKSGYFATVDEDTNELVMRAQSGYPDWIVRAYGRVAMDAPVPGAEAIRSGRAVFIESPQDRRLRYPEYAEDPAHAAFVVMPLPPMDDARSVLAFGFEDARHFDDDDRRYMNTILEACASALQRANAFEAEQRARDRLRTVLDASEQLGALDDPARVTETIARVAATRIGKWATVVRLLPDGRLDRAVSAHRDPALSPLVHQTMEQLTDAGASVRHVIDEGGPMLYHGLTDAAAKLIHDNPKLRADLERIGYESCLLVPITIAGRRLAVLTIGDDRPERLRAVDVELAVDLGRRGASALERARLWQSNRQRLEQEHRIVELLQRTIVPDRLPDLPRIQLAAAYRPAEVEVDVGGDWYDAFIGADNALVLVVGDVAGHGLQAASLMGRTRNALRAYGAEDSRPASILQRLHALLRAQDSLEMVTAFVARIDPESHEMSWSRAGHLPPLLADPSGISWLDEINGAPLGTMTSTYETHTRTLAPGSLLVCYTDGLVERRDRVLDDGLDWLAEQVRKYADDDLATLCDKLVDDPFVPHPAPDDMCVLALRTTSP